MTSHRSVLLALSLVCLLPTLPSAHAGGSMFCPNDYYMDVVGWGCIECSPCPRGSSMLRRCGAYGDTQCLITQRPGDDDDGRYASDVSMFGDMMGGGGGGGDVDDGRYASVDSMFDNMMGGGGGGNVDDGRYGSVDSMFNSMMNEGFPPDMFGAMVTGDAQPPLDIAAMLSPAVATGGDDGGYDVSYSMSEGMQQQDGGKPVVKMEYSVVDGMTGKRVGWEYDSRTNGAAAAASSETTATTDILPTTATTDILPPSEHNTYEPAATHEPTETDAYEPTGTETFEATAAERQDYTAPDVGEASENLLIGEFVRENESDYGILPPKQTTTPHPPWMDGVIDSDDDELLQPLVFDELTAETVAPPPGALNSGDAGLQQQEDVVYEEMREYDYRMLSARHPAFVAFLAMGAISLIVITLVCCYCRPRKTVDDAASDVAPSSIYTISSMLQTDSQKKLANMDAVVESRRPQFHFQNVDLLDEKRFSDA
ncbi:PREDICTED: uncharacterized protein LOC106816008 [Priapulus caudatus]|uniref:Uncharacterized protein LOC106816008 n=1 Tax=Priapulus caudatus TaxID=37621 RepID=A0ABM1EV06_PRICU|nr:PREDICTED: uncharacterized protein LOC106816008 [Priapulus caudatus]